MVWLYSGRLGEYNDVTYFSVDEIPKEKMGILSCGLLLIRFG